MSNPTLASITAELEAVETAARGRGSLTCDHLAGRIANIRGELQQIAQPQPPAEPQPVACDEDRFEQFLQAAIARSPEPLRELVEYLAGVLDDDQWPAADRLLLQLATATPSAPVGVEDLSCCGGNDETPKSHCMDCSRYPGQLAQQPAATLPDVDDDDLTVAYMAGRHDGRKEVQQPTAVDEAMVDEALRSWFECDDWSSLLVGIESVDRCRSRMIRALTAALDAQQGGA